MALLQVKTLPDVTIATIPGESIAEAVWKELSALASRLGGRGLHLDLGEVRFLSSVELGKLISLYKQVRAEGGRLSLQNVRPCMRSSPSLA
jgi:anti-anti-sigma factor